VAPVEVSLREERGSPAVEMRMSPGGAANAVLQRAMSGAAAPGPLEVSAVVRTASDWAAPPLEMGERRSAMGHLLGGRRECTSRPERGPHVGLSQSPIDNSNNTTTRDVM
jgi:hypothetical protein